MWAHLRFALYILGYPLAKAVLGLVAQADVCPFGEVQTTRKWRMHIEVIFGFTCTACFGADPTGNIKNSFVSKRALEHVHLPFARPAHMMHWQLAEILDGIFADRFGASNPASISKPHYPYRNVAGRQWGKRCTYDQGGLRTQYYGGRDLAPILGLWWWSAGHQRLCNSSENASYLFSSHSVSGGAEAWRCTVGYQMRLCQLNFGCT